MLARLAVLSGAKTKQMDLRLPTIMGRGGAAKIKLPSATVSRQHCEIYDYQGRIAIRDLGSSNGTIVNGHRIQDPTFVTPDDEIVVGPIRFRLAYVDDSGPASAADIPKSTSVPDLEKFPAETNTPVSAVDNRIATPTAPHDLPVIDQVADDQSGSVLEYVAPNETQPRSFVGIVTDDERPASEHSSPRLDTARESAEAVADDDSSLKSFLDNLDG